MPRFGVQHCTHFWCAASDPALGRSLVPGLTGTSCSQRWFYLKPPKWRHPAGPARATGPPGDSGTGRGLGARPRPLPGGQPGGTGSGAGAARKDGRGVLSPRFGPHGDTVSCPCPYREVASRLAVPPCCGGHGDMCHPIPVPVGMHATPLLSPWGLGVPPGRATPLPLRRVPALTGHRGSPSPGRPPPSAAPPCPPAPAAPSTSAPPNPARARPNPAGAEDLSAVTPTREAPKGAGEGMDRVSPSG